MRVAAMTLAVLLLARPAVAADPHAAARRARDALSTLLVTLANEARARGDVTAAQAIGETAQHVSGVPHPHLDALRRELVRGFAAEKADDAAVAAAWRAVRPHCEVLARSARDWDVLDARVVAQIPEVLPAVRALSRARQSCGLHAVRYDARRCVRALRGGPLDWDLYWTPQGDGPPAASVGRLMALTTPARIRAMFLVPADKGLSIGTRVTERGTDFRLGPSGNLAPIPRGPTTFRWPVDGATGVRIGSESRWGPPTAEISFHHVGSAPWLGQASATLRPVSATRLAPKAPCVLRMERAHGQTILVITPPAPLRAGTTYRIDVDFGTMGSIEDWRFTTAE